MQLSQLHVQLSYQRRSKRFHCPRMSTLTLLTLDMNMHVLLACAFVDILENITHGYTALETYLLWFIFSYDRNTLSVVL